MKKNKKDRPPTTAAEVFARYNVVTKDGLEPEYMVLAFKFPSDAHIKVISFCPEDKILQMFGGMIETFHNQIKGFAFALLPCLQRFCEAKQKEAIPTILDRCTQGNSERRQ